MFLILSQDDAVGSKKNIHMLVVVHEVSTVTQLHTISDLGLPFLQNKELMDVKPTLPRPHKSMENAIIKYLI